MREMIRSGSRFSARVKTGSARAMRFEKIEERLAKIEASLVQLPKTILKSILEQLPKAVKKEIGFKSRT